MPVPTSMQDLSAAAASNSPQGSENVAPNLDNYLRAHAAIVRQTYALATSSIASASTTDVAAADGESVEITGAATINSLGTGFAGCVRELRFSGAVTLAASANIQGLPGSVNLTVAAGETAVFRCVAAGQWRFVGMSRVLGFTPVNRAGDMMTGTLNSTAQDYVSSTRGGYSYTHVNVGDGGIGLYDGTANTFAWKYNTASGGSTNFRGEVRASGEVISTANDGQFRMYGGANNNNVNRHVSVVHNKSTGRIGIYDNLNSAWLLLIDSSNVGYLGSNTIWHAGNCARTVVASSDPGAIGAGNVWIKPV